MPCNKFSRYDYKKKQNKSFTEMAFFMEWAIFHFQ